MPVNSHLRGSILLVTLDREEKRNAFNPRMTTELSGTLDAFEADATARVCVLTGGGHVFSAGTDLVEGGGHAPGGAGSYGIAARRLSKPLIAAVEGVAAGGGFEIVMAATLVVASETATFSLPEVKLGLVAECGGLFRGPRALPLNVARELLLTGRPLSARRAFELGFVNAMTPDGGALDGAMALAEEIASLAPLAVRETLLALETMSRLTDEVGWDATERSRGVVRASIDSVEGVDAFLHRRPPVWIGS